ncbi:glutathione S-transferase family protein [Sphingomonas sp.]|jgi:glutathione S-transferase|uniref:glutathione S-transferase family protein n=1 Tax=Sphingomonas sp. TaxID=28214 RepID=UPI002EDAE2F9
MLTLYGHPFSRAHRNMWMLKELGAGYDHVPTDFLKGGTREPEFLAVNPNGRVPALVDDGQPFFESLAINLYLARKFGGPLAPANPIEDGLATQWSFWVANEVEKPLLFASANLKLFADGVPAHAAIGLGKLDRPFRVLDKELVDKPYLLGDRFTVADLNVAAVMTLGVISGVPFHAYPAMQEWLHRCIERPAAADWKPIQFSIPRPPTVEGLLAMFL